MEASKEKIRSLWVPLRGMNLLLPNMAVAEISSYRVPEALPDMPEWLLGTVKWDGVEIAVISLEALCGIRVPSNPVFSRLMIVNSVRRESKVKNYAIVTAGLPGLIQFGHDTPDEYSDFEEEGLQCMVRIGNEEAIIPDLDHLQGMLEDQLDQAA
ncbi:MAG: chemotaxis protein CheW [Halobacteria archaeon]|nr:chemotaxis protein CheW [Halobacteria archaeon]